MYRDSRQNYGNIAPTDRVISPYAYIININENCPDSAEILIRVNITSNGYFFWSDTLKILVQDIKAGISKINNNIPYKFNLHQNYPNPFNPKTTISYQLPKDCFVELSIYSMLGQRIETLVSKRQNAGNYHFEWDATSRQSEIASGVYFYQLTAGDFKQCKKLIVLK